MADFAAAHDLSACTLDGLLADPTINYVLNLTPADAHENITRACLEAGKSVYSEKPLAASLEGADALIALAAERGLLLACAPATFLWPPLATARRLISEGQLGPIAGALSMLVYPGPEIFHPHPAHLYGVAAGPLHDMGVYQVSALIALLGPVINVVGMASQAFTERTIKVGPDAGTNFSVETPTHIHAQLLHASGAISSMIVSFDGHSASPPSLELFGRDAGLSIKNAHSPDATLMLKRGGEPQSIRLDGPPWSVAYSAIGPTSAWNAFQADQPVPTSDWRARHVLAVLLAIEASSDRGDMMVIAG